MGGCQEDLNIKERRNKKKRRGGGFCSLQCAAYRVQYSQSEMKCSIAYMADVTRKKVLKTKCICPFLLVEGGSVIASSVNGNIYKKMHNEKLEKVCLFFNPVLLLSSRGDYLFKKTWKDYNLASLRKALSPCCCSSGAQWLPVKGQL